MTDEAPTLASSTDYADAVATAVQAAAAYYTDGSAPLGDDEYDALLRAIAAYEDTHPGEVLPDSPTGKVAAGAVQGDIPHSVPTRRRRQGRLQARQGRGTRRSREHTAGIRRPGRRLPDQPVRAGRPHPHLVGGHQRCSADLRCLGVRWCHPNLGDTTEDEPP
ncbi:hypothetical protein [Kitasatospora sp. NBC_01300]|uniref:hypothetical protein n=1 Tax=Kitasatospora sp. NBC_01300 TaxID=2903574 RepID=UPI002F9090A8|nr:hypothetical protein OG556_40570 [Kitasatospora sp. NBC_01300]